MKDELGIVYLVENAQQFWSGALFDYPLILDASRLYFCSTELDDVLQIPNDATTLSLLDSALRRFLDLCAEYHGAFCRSFNVPFIKLKPHIQSNTCKARYSSDMHATFCLTLNCSRSIRKGCLKFLLTTSSRLVLSPPRLTLEPKQYYRTRILIHNSFFTISFCLMVDVTQISFVPVNGGNRSLRYLWTTSSSRSILTHRTLTLG